MGAFEFLFSVLPASLCCVTSQWAAVGGVGSLAPVMSYLTMATQAKRQPASGVFLLRVLHSGELARKERVALRKARKGCTEQA